jgi:hypothetical protein
MNQLKVHEEWWSGKLSVSWTLQQSVMPFPNLQSIDGKVHIIPPGSDWFVPKPKILIHDDGYPAMEIYSSRNGVVRTIYRHWAWKNTENLWPLIGDITKDRALYMWYPGYAG